jgi:hypothetical protein
MKFKNALLNAAFGLLSAFSVLAANVKIQGKEFLPTYTVTVLTTVPGVDLTLPTGIFTAELLTAFDDQGDFKISRPGSRALEHLPASLSSGSHLISEARSGNDLPTSEVKFPSRNRNEVVTEVARKTN